MSRRQESFLDLSSVSFTPELAFWSDSVAYAATFPPTASKMEVPDSQDSASSNQVPIYLFCSRKEAFVEPQATGITACQFWTLEALMLLKQLAISPDRLF